jgi:hypothetical protein
MWKTNLSFQNESLKDAILGFAAFYLRYLDPLDEEMARASHQYMLRALRGHAQDLRSGIDETNAEAAFATSTLVAVHACMSQKFFTASKAPQAPMHWFRPYQGIVAV